MPPEWLQLSQSLAILAKSLYDVDRKRMTEIDHLKRSHNQKSNNP